MLFWCESGSQKHSERLWHFASGDDDLLVRNRCTVTRCDTPFTLVSHFASMIISPMRLLRLRLPASWCSAADQSGRKYGQFDVVNIAADTIAIFQTNDLLPSPFTSVVCAFRIISTFSGCAVCPAEPGRLSFLAQIPQRYVLNDTRQVNCRFHAGVTPPITATRLPLNSGPSQCGQWSRLWCDTDLRPERSCCAILTGRHDNAACFQYRARSCFNLCRPPSTAAGISLLALWLSINQRRIHQRELSAHLPVSGLRLRYRNVVFDINGIEDLTTKTSPIRPVRMPLRAE